MSKIEIRSVHTNKELMTFIKFPWKVYKEDPYWVPPLISEQLRLFSHKKNPFFNHSFAELFIAYRRDEVVGRIAAILNNNHNNYNDTNIGFFGFFESLNDKQVVQELLTTVTKWLRNKGCNRVMGPINFSINDQVGVLIDGFNSPPYIMLPHNPKYYHEILEDLGFEKVKDFYSYFVTEGTFVNHSSIERINDKLKKRHPVRIREVNLKNFNSEIEILRNIYNESFSNSWGFVPMDELEFKFKSDQLKKIINPKLLLVAEYKDNPVGFVLALPNFNEVLIKIHDGKLFPFGFARILLNTNRIKGIRVITICIMRQYQHLGLGSLFYSEITNRIFNNKFDNFEMSWVMEDNIVMNNIVKKLGGIKYKTYRVYASEITLL